MEIKRYLIASELNDYRPWILTSQALVVFCLIIWSIRLLTPFALTIAAGGIDAQDLINRINAERTQRFIPAFTTNSKLTTAAVSKASDMLTRSYFAHVDPDGNYVWSRVEAAGYQPYLTLGENLAMDFTSAGAVVDAWMNSPTHRANIVNEKFEDQGMASVAGTFEPNHDTVVIANLFGTLYKTAKAANPPPPPPAPIAKTKTPPPAPKQVKEEKEISVAPEKITIQPPSPPPASVAVLQISNDVKIDISSLSRHNMVSLNVVINGLPTLVTAKLKSQSITLIPGKVQGEFVGSFTFDATEDLSNQMVTVEARDKAGTKTTQDFAVNIPPDGVVGQDRTIVPASNEAEIIKFLRIIFGVFAAVYMGFLIIDAIIIHRAKINRPGIHTNTHALIFLLLAAVSIFANWF